MQKNLESFITLLFMGGGAGALFFSIVILKPMLNEADYGSFAGLITLALIVSSLGLLSYEQSLLRMAKIGLPNYGLPKNSFKCAVVLTAATSAFASYVFVSFFEQSGSIIKVFFICALISVFLYMSSIERLRERYIESQIISNTWKLIFFIILLFSYIWGGVEYAEVETILLASCVAGLVVIVTIRLISPRGIRRNKDDAEFSSFSKQGVVYLTATYFFSTSIIILINNFDKFYIENMLGKEELGEYFHMLTLYTYPFLLFSNLIGLRLLIEFKLDFTFSKLLAKIGRVSIFVIPVLVFYYSIIFLVEVFFDPGYIVNSYLVLVLALVSISRVVYSIISAAAGAVGSAVNIIVANISFLVLACCVVAFVYVEIDSVVEVALLVFAFLLMRAVSYVISLRLERHV